VLVVNETLRTLRDRTGMHYYDPGVHTRDVREFEGSEHAHPAWHYRVEAVRATCRPTLDRTQGLR